LIGANKKFQLDNMCPEVKDLTIQKSDVHQVKEQSFFQQLID
jgi:hypothetical protein